jgi:hypothetical protein
MATDLHFFPRQKKRDDFFPRRKKHIFTLHEPPHTPPPNSRAQGHTGEPGTRPPESRAQGHRRAGRKATGEPGARPTGEPGARPAEAQPREKNSKKVRDTNRGTAAEQKFEQDAARKNFRDTKSKIKKKFQTRIFKISKKSYLNLEGRTSAPPPGGGEPNTHH